MSISETPGIAPAVVVAEETMSNNDRSYVDWPAIFAGTVVAVAISFVLLTFGSAIGLSMTSANEGEASSLFWFAIVAGLWLLWVQVSASIAGGYLTGRMRRRHGDATEYESDIRDGSHGLVVWGLATLVAAFIAFSGLSGAANVAGQTAGAAASAVGAAAGEAADGMDLGDLVVDRTLRGAPGAEPVAEGTRAEVGRILLSAATNEGGLDQADRQYLVATVAARAGISEEEAGQRIDQILAQAQELEADARAAAEQARRAGMVAAFLAAASLLVSAAAAYFGATMGGNHRDNQTVVEGWYKPW